MKTKNKTCVKKPPNQSVMQDGWLGSRGWAYETVSTRGSGGGGYLWVRGGDGVCTALGGEGKAKSGGGHATPSSSWEVPGLPSHQGLESPDGSEPIYLDTLL